VHCSLQLLQPSSHCVRVTVQKTVVVEHAVVKVVRSREHLTNIVRARMEKGKVGGTAMNETSSRSHIILAIVVESIDKRTGSMTTGKVRSSALPPPLAAIAAT